MDSAALLLPATGLAAFECPQLRKQQKPLLVPTGADVAAAGSAALVDVFQIDDLLDFSNEDIAGPIETEADSLLAVNSCSSSLPAPVPSSAAAVQQKAEAFDHLQAAAASSVEKATAEQLHHHHHHSTAKPQQVEEEEEIEAHGMIEADLCVPVSPELPACHSIVVCRSLLLHWVAAVLSRFCKETSPRAKLQSLHQQLVLLCFAAVWSRHCTHK
jgi:hypothetical protein